MRIKIARPSYSMNVKTREKRYWVHIEEWSLAHYLRGKIYHWYDMRFPIKVPGWKRFERLLQRLLGADIGRAMGFAPDFEGYQEPRWRDRIVGWTYLQDIRCFHLNDEEYNDARWITTFELDEETYEAFKRPRQDSNPQQPR